MRVVLVDDRKSAIFAIGTPLLDIKGIDVVSFTIPGEAPDCRVETIANPIIVDLVMPGRTGIDLINPLIATTDDDASHSAKASHTTEELRTSL